MSGGKIEAGDDKGLKITHSESYTGEDVEETSYTTTIRYATSTDAGMVGAAADTYIGYSTNLAFSRTTNLNFIKANKYNNTVQEEKLDSKDSEWKLIQSEGLGVAKQFATTFVYSQQHIIDVLIPQLEERRNNVLAMYDYATYSTWTNEELKDLANERNELVIISTLPPGDENYGKTNTSGQIDRYRYFYPDNYLETTGRADADTILYLNQSIEKWEEQIRKNEQAKVYAIENRDNFLVENYSFQGGLDIEYSEQYSTTNEHTSTWEVVVGAGMLSNSDLYTFGNGVKITCQENINTTQSGSESSSASREHAKGFILSDDATSNYLSVDVMREPKWNEENNTYEEWNIDWYENIPA